MRQSHLTRFALGLVLLYGGATASPAVAEPLSESAKIERLIAHVRALRDSEFVRNGKAYDGAAAADHLQAKWSKGKDQIATARDFIAKVATRSESSGKPYAIRFKDGREQESAAYLGAQLDALEKAAK